MSISLKNQNRINIVHFLYDSLYSPWVSGGGAYRTIEIYKRFPKNYNITIICGNYKGKKIYKLNNIHFYYIGNNFNYFISRITYTISGTLYFLKNYKKFDLIINDYCCYSPINTYKANNSIVVIQNFFGQNLIKKFFILGLIPYLYEKVEIKKFNNFIFSSNTMKNKFSKYLNLKNIYYDIIPYGVDEKLFKAYKKGSEGYILYLGRIEFYQKGLDILIKAMEQPDLKNIKLIIAGTGKDEKKLLIRIKAHPNIKYIGRIDGEKKYNVLKHARFLVMPSRYESFGIVAVEGAAVSKPVIGLSDSGLEETIINNKTGYLLKEKNYKILADTIYNLWTNKKLTNQLGKNGKIFARNFKWDIVTKKQLHYYNEVLKRTGYSSSEKNSLIKDNINYTNQWWASNILGFKDFLYTERIHYYYFLKFFKENKKELYDNKKLIDIGFGTGTYIEYLSKKYNLTTIGLDISKKTVALYNQRIKKLNSRAQLIDPYTNKLSFKKNEIDYVICSHLLEHVPDDDFLLNEIYRVIKQNGIIFFNIPINEEKLNIPTHIRKYTITNFNKKLKNHGFKIIKSFESDNFTYTINYLALNKNLINNILKKTLILILSFIPIKFLESFRMKKSQYICLACKSYSGS